MNDLELHGGLAVLSSLLIELLKRSNLFPWVGYHTPTLTRIINIAASVLVGLGFQTDHSGSLVEGGTIVIHYPMFSAIVESAARIAFSYSLNEAAYRTLMKKKTTEQVDKEVDLLDNETESSK